MNFPRYWASATSNGFTCWRWSNTSLSEAESQARAAAVQLAERFRLQGRILERYGYPDRPLREPVLREFHDPSGRLNAVLTRNSYGCEILNTSAAMFVDIDLAKDAELPGALARAESWAHKQAGWNWRVYRTRGGLRLLATHRLFDPKEPECQAVFDAVAADPLYRRLCLTQECFRARLTPKPWRCAIPNPPARWPFSNIASEARFADWVVNYRAVSNTRATCFFIRTMGSGAVHPELQPVIALHDDATRAGTNLPLA